MKKCLLFLFLAFLAVLSTWANPIDRQQAQAHAEAFLRSRGQAVSVVAELPTHRSVRKSGKFVNQAAFYVFNTASDAGNTQGFVIISGDDRTAPVLGYAPEGNFDATNLPPNFQEWLQACEEMISRLDATESLHQTEEPVLTAVAPLLTTRWDQGAPYNTACPTYQGEPTLTGCTATALAQVMNYTRWPEGECTAIPAYTSPSYRIKMPELPATTFDWDATADASDGEVARLMLYAGQSVKSDYTVNSTAGAFTMIPQVLEDYFGYDTNVRYVLRSNYSIAQWDELLHGELAAGRPVLYSGFTTSSGHAFVCDGYDGLGLYHINWGWSGAYDGYYEISLLRPGMGGSGGSSTSDGYAMMQGAVIGIQPPTGEAALPLKLTSGELRVEGKKVHCNFYNYNADTLQCYIGFGRITNQGILYPVKTYENTLTFGPIVDGNVRVAGYSFDAAAAALPIGRHNVVPICREYGSTAWNIISADGNYVEVNVKSGSNITLTLHPVNSLQATAIQVIGNKVEGRMQDVQVEFSNPGEEVNNYIYLFASTNPDEKGKYAGRTQVAIPEGGTATAFMNFLPTATGTHHLWICADEAGNQVLGTATVDIRTAPTEAAKLQRISQRISTQADGSVRVIVKFRNAGTDTYLRPLWMGLQLSGSWAAQTEIFTPVEPEAEAEVEAHFTNLTPGKTYAAYSYYYPNFDDYTFQLLAGPTKFIAPQPTAITHMPAEAEDAHAPCYTLQGIRVQQPVSPGVYIQAGKKIIVR